MPGFGVKIDVGKIRAALLWLIGGVLFLAVPHRAYACGNAVSMSVDKRTATLVRAQEALDESDLDTARELAGEILEDAIETDLRGPQLDWSVERAKRVVALSYVRDYDVTASQLVEAHDILRARLYDPKRMSSPSMEAEYAEAEARIANRQHSAHATLKSLAERDLLGSPHALGALNRVSRQRNDPATAAMAYGACAKMIGATSSWRLNSHPSIVCEGKYESSPLLRGRPSGYAIPGALFVAALAYRLLRLRRSKRRDAQPSPWIGYAPRVQTLAIAIAGFYLFARPTSPIATSFVVATLLALSFFVERRGFFGALRRGSIPGLVVRPTIGDDAHLVPLGFLTGAKADETVERVYEESEAEPGYRDPSRVPLFRLVPRHRLPAGVAAAVLVATVFALALLAVSTLALRAI